MKKFKLIIAIFMLLLLSSCIPYKIKAEANSATTEQQNEVKQQVLKLLTDEYKQPFKLEDFSYKYETHWEHIDCQIAGYCPKVQYGTYYLKIKAIDNPIIVMHIEIKDKNKESIKRLINSFKKSQLKDLYCGAFFTYYGMTLKNNKKLQQPYTNRIEKFCDNRGQSSYKTFKDYYSLHESENT